MKPRKCVAICLLCGLGWLGTVSAVRADAKANPYQPIVERNAFGLKPPPPPQSDLPPPPPPPPLAKVTLTGITSMFGPSSKRALLEIIEQEPGKAATPRKPILREGERDGSVEIVSINVEKNMVTIRNGSVETNITFEVQKSPSGPASGGAPMTAGALPTPGLTAPTPSLAHSAAAGPTIISRDGGATPITGSSVTVIGANPATSSAGGSFSSSSPSSSAYAAANTTQFGGAQGGLRIPPRQLRTDVGGFPNQQNVGGFPNQQQNQQQQHLPRDQQAVLIELNREMTPPGKGPPLPPTALNPTGQPGGLNIE